MMENHFKTALYLAAAMAITAVSCDKETAESDTSAVTCITARFEQQPAQEPTKVTYEEIEKEGDGYQLRPDWEFNDKVIGFDDNGNTYTLTVLSVDNRVASLKSDNPISDGALHLIYKSGASASDIEDKKLAVSYLDQNGDRTMPAVMLADGTIEEGKGDFTFRNAGAVIGISAMKGMSDRSRVSRITVRGENLSEATVLLNENTLKLTDKNNSDDAIRTTYFSDIITWGDDGALRTIGNFLIVTTLWPQALLAMNPSLRDSAARPGGRLRYPRPPAAGRCKAKINMALKQAWRHIYFRFAEREGLSP